MLLLVALSLVPREAVRIQPWDTREEDDAAGFDDGEAVRFQPRDTTDRDGAMRRLRDSSVPTTVEHD